MAVAAFGLGACGGGTSHAHAGPTFGPLPSFLSKVATGLGHTVVDATDAHPVLATQGDTVRAHLPNGGALVTLAGPEVPVGGVVPEPTTSNATFTLSFASVTGTVPVDISKFSTSDDVGNIYPLHVVPGSPAPPATLKAGQSFTTKVETVMPVGEGLMRWAPIDHILVEWDFVVEVD